MQQFATFKLLLEAVQAIPGYIPPFVSAFSYPQEYNSDGTIISRTIKYTYHQELQGSSYKLRECLVRQTVDADDNDLGAWYLYDHSTSETVEGFTRVVNAPAGQQPIEYQLSSCAFELPTDADVAAYNTAIAASTAPPVPRGTIEIEGAGAASDTNPIYSYHHYQIPAALTLGDIAAEWENIPRFTSIETETGFYTTPGDNTTWHRMGGFTYTGQGITLCGTNTNPAKMPPGGIWATVDLVPSLPIVMASGVPVLDSNGVPEIDYAVAGGDYAHLMNGTAAVFNLYIRIKITRTRPCDLMADNVTEIRPYVDIDWDMTRKK